MMMSQITLILEAIVLWFVPSFCYGGDLGSMIVVISLLQCDVSECIEDDVCSGLGYGIQI